MSSETYAPHVWPALTTEDIREIRRIDEEDDDLTYGDIAERFGISKEHVEMIVESDCEERALLDYEIATRKWSAPNTGAFFRLIKKADRFE